MIYHLTTAIEWKMAQQAGTYSAPSLDTEGFIHCSTREQVLPVANAFYMNEEELVILCINEDKLEADVKWEAPAHIEGHEPPANSDDNLFPHIYGIINIDAVDNYVMMPKDDSGYHLPDGI
ncbi:MAG: DUF952 domain-containing protein [Phototrophicaceae bacterium]